MKHVFGLIVAVWAISPLAVEPRRPKPKECDSPLGWHSAPGSAKSQQRGSDKTIPKAQEPLFGMGIKDFLTSFIGLVETTSRHPKSKPLKYQFRQLRDALSNCLSGYKEVKGVLYPKKEILLVNFVFVFSTVSGLLPQIEPSDVKELSRYGNALFASRGKEFTPNLLMRGLRDWQTMLEQSRSNGLNVELIQKVSELGEQVNIRQKSNRNATGEELEQFRQLLEEVIQETEQISDLRFQPSKETDLKEVEPNVTKEVLKFAPNLRAAMRSVYSSNHVGMLQAARSTLQNQLGASIAYSEARNRLGEQALELFKDYSYNSEN